MQSGAGEAVSRPDHHGAEAPIGAGLLLVCVVATIFWYGRRHAQYEQFRDWCLVSFVLVASLLLAAAVMSGWLTGTDVY